MTSFVLVSRLTRCVAAFAALCATGAALCAPATSASAATVAMHGLGAKRPQHQVAPRVPGRMGALAALPVRVDLRAWAVTPGDQGAVGSCVTWAIDYGMLGWYSRRTGRAGQPFAPMYTYSQINGGRDEGSSPGAAFEIARTQGSDTRAHYSHGDYDWRDKPNAAERANAAQYKIGSWNTLFAGNGQAGSADAIKQALAEGKPVAIEMAVRHGFDVLGPAPAAVDDDAASPIRGYHEVLALGYDAAGLIVENSWGTGWANGGFGRISWRVVARDVWEADTISGFAAVTPPSVTSPSVVMVAAATQHSSTVSYRITWKGAPGSTGAITQYDAWYRIGTGPLVSVKLPSLKATSFTLQTRVGRTYRVAVRARAGRRVSALRFSAPIEPTPPTPPPTPTPAPPTPPTPPTPPPAP